MTQFPEEPSSHVDADFDALAALPEFARFSAILTRLTGVPMVLHSLASGRHVTYGREIRNPLCRLIRATSAGAKRCAVCDAGHGRMSASRKRPLLYKCHAGLFDMIIPLYVRGRHVANLLSGQLLGEPPSEAGFARLRTRLHWLQADAATLRKAYYAAGHQPKTKVKQIMGLLEIFSGQLCESLRRIHELESHLERSEIRKAKACVNSRFSDPALRLADAAASAGLSPAHFSHIFKQNTGSPFTRHVQRVRLDEAKRLLRRKDKSVSEVCYACGFNSMANFIRVFRLLEQTTPGAFRDAVRATRESGRE